MNERKCVVLCIDDDQDVLDSVRLILESRGCIVQTAASAGAGLKLYQAGRPDLVIVDLMMEEADSGITFVQKIKTLGPMPPVYMLSSVGDALTWNVDSETLNLTGVLQKPVVPEVLLKTVEHVLKRF